MSSGSDLVLMKFASASALVCNLPDPECHIDSSTNPYTPDPIPNTDSMPESLVVFYTLYLYLS